MAVIPIFVQMLFAAFLLHVEMQKEGSERDFFLFVAVCGGLIGGFLFTLRDLLEGGL